MQLCLCSIASLSAVVLPYTHLPLPFYIYFPYLLSSQSKVECYASMHAHKSRSIKYAYRRALLFKTVRWATWEPHFLALLLLCLQSKVERYESAITAILVEERQEADLRKAEMEASKVCVAYGVVWYPSACMHMVSYQMHACMWYLTKCMHACGILPCACMHAWSM